MSYGAIDPGAESRAGEDGAGVARAGDQHGGSLHPKTLLALKRLIELVVEGGGQLSIVLVGHPKLKNDLRRPKMEEIGDRTTVFEFGGLRARQRDFIDWGLKAWLGGCGR